MYYLKFGKKSILLTFQWENHNSPYYGILSF